MNPLSLLEVPAAVISTVIFAVLLGLAAQRLLGIRLGPVRLLATGLFATLVLPAIGLALVDVPAQGEPLANPQREFWFFLLAAMCTLLASMVFIVVVEAFAPLGSIPPATVWGRGLTGRWRRARRSAQVLGLALRHGLGPYLRDRRGLDAPSARAQLGRALRETLEAGGVTFVKMGQLLSTRTDALPAEVSVELAQLQEGAAPVPWERIRSVLQEELAAPPEEVFAEIDPVPLAAASIGQVHAARLTCGQEVVVKVQRPGIRPAVERDLDIAVRLAARLERTTSWGRSMGALALAEGLGAAIREELDFRVEADNIATVARALPDGSGVRLPMPHHALSTDRVLVMDRLRGVPISQAAPLLDTLGIDRSAVARALLETLLRQILVEGVFHADPHAGNIFVLEDGSIGLLDLGSVGRLDASLRAGLERLLLGFDKGDPLAVTDALLDLAPSTGDVDGERLERDIGRLLARHATGGGQVRAARMLTDTIGLVTFHSLEIPPEVAAVFRCIGTAEGTLRQLEPAFDVVTTSRELAGQLLGERMRPSDVRRAFTEELIELVPILRRLPRRIERITSAVERGRLRVEVRPFADERDRAWLTGLLHDTLVTGLAGVVGLMAALLLGSDGGPRIRDGVGLHALIGYNLLVVSAMLGIGILAKVFRRRR
jgi:ubiquinone biosynthesis protein